MKSINYKHSKGITEILFSKNILANIFSDDHVIICDENIYRLYFDEIKAFRHIVVPNGEDCKSFNVVENLVSELLKYNLDKSSILLGFGGGAVLDLTGFVASIFKRGISHSFVPTTILSQIDASIGGKTAINYQNNKNCIGTIKQADKILCNSNYLSSLPKDEIISGLGELIKTLVIFDREYFYQFKDLITEDSDINLSKMDEYFRFCAKKKAEIIEKDEFETNLRKILNFGHTLGHAIELKYNMKHGAAVYKGMIYAMEFSAKLGLLNPLIIKEMNKFNSIFAQYIDLALDKNIIKDYIIQDKKITNNKIDFIFLCDIAKPTIKSIDINILMEFIDEHVG